ncbi:hypothetical protein [Priestia aryabhattai]|uniref:hypothetical protein n=1 Tax=Priestia aryabhattai TaxID=412384 RepID=UPI003D2C69F3
MISVECVSRILYRFRVGITEGNVLSLLQQGLLKKAPNLNTSSHVTTKYNFSVNTDSLLKLLHERGISSKEIADVLQM